MEKTIRQVQGQIMASQFVTETRILQPVCDIKAWL